MLKKSAVLAAVLLLNLVLTACAGSQEFNVVDLREKLGTVTKETTGDIDNSKGTDELDTNINAKRQFRHVVDLKLNSTANLDESKVKQRIYDTYDIADAGGEKSCIIPAQVPAGHIYAYDIEWTQVIREGNIQEGKVQGQGNLLGTYTVIIDLQCQVVGAEVRQ